MATGFGFPFGVSPDGAIAPDPDEDVDLRGKIIQVLFTAPGERVNQPEFGCGLFNLVFDPNNTILAAAMEFIDRPGTDPLAGLTCSWWQRSTSRSWTRPSTSRWPTSIAQDLSRQAVRIHFSEDERWRRSRGERAAPSSITWPATTRACCRPCRPGPGEAAGVEGFTNEADFGNVLLQLFAHMGDILSYYQDRVANESFLGTARTRRSVIEHLRLIGYQARHRGARVGHPDT